VKLCEFFRTGLRTHSNLANKKSTSLSTQSSQFLSYLRSLHRSHRSFRISLMFGCRSCVHEFGVSPCPSVKSPSQTTGVLLQTYPRSCNASDLYPNLLGREDFIPRPSHRVNNLKPHFLIGEKWNVNLMCAPPTLYKV